MATIPEAVGLTDEQVIVSDTLVDEADALPDWGGGITYILDREDVPDEVKAFALFKLGAKLGSQLTLERLLKRG